MTFVFVDVCVCVVQKEIKQNFQEAPEIDKILQIPLQCYISNNNCRREETLQPEELAAFCMVSCSSAATVNNCLG